MKLHLPWIVTALFTVTSGASLIRCCRVVAVLVVLFVGALFSIESSAATLSPASFEVTASGSSTPDYITVPGTLTNSECYPASNGGGCETSFGSASAGLAVSANISTSGAQPPTSGGTGTVASDYEITGPGNVSVPLIVSGNLWTSASGFTASAQAYIEYSIYASPFDTCSSGAGLCGTTPQSGSLSAVSFSAPSNSLNRLETYAQAVGGVSGPSFAAAQVSGFTLGIDPTWLTSNPGYSLEFSPNVTPVPLPAAAWLFGSGLLGLMGICCRKVGASSQLRLGNAA